jgi:hypothetical protein
LTPPDKERGDEKEQQQQHTERLKAAIRKFLNTTQIHREVALYSLTSKSFAAEGFNPQWQLYHLRHVCVRGGNDGIYMGNELKKNRFEPDLRVNQKA